ncbi:spectrin beta chain, non-erythrocytic 5 [Heterocephalus glaber]|uniref:Spectrin beta chain, non-erythrocytic 5 n=1 Tax=Heterocephalus glaber TaxID=10181 RepID=A0AAX6RJI7_HETGA|nr:spectrin beta chain, non-erythrocytic 5 [Heterocephalus glaber]XP_021097481.1 spectrin beta chain, non-erythrocytic 5 [Heterocephalus glaber]XP_021097483.1 spectrin beta chain, non-erythrocytic 5 [Heterocephalus glaber]
MALGRDRSQIAGALQKHKVVPALVPPGRGLRTALSDEPDFSLDLSTILQTQDLGSLEPGLREPACPGRGESLPSDVAQDLHAAETQLRSHKALERELLATEHQGEAFLAQSHLRAGEATQRLRGLQGSGEKLGQGPLQGQELEDKQNFLDFLQKAGFAEAWIQEQPLWAPRSGPRALPAALQVAPRVPRHQWARTSTGGGISKATCSSTSGSLRGPWRSTHCPES